MEAHGTDWNTSALDNHEIAEVRAEQARARCPIDRIRDEVWEQASKELMGDPADSVMNAMLDADVVKAALRVVFRNTVGGPWHGRTAQDILPRRYILNGGEYRDRDLIERHLIDAVESEIDRRATEWTEEDT